MAAGDNDLTLYFRKKHTPPPSVLLLTLPDEKGQKDRVESVSPPGELRPRQQKKRQTTPHNSVSHAQNSDTQESSRAASGWQRHSEKIAQISAAPDVAYRNTYLDDLKRQKSASTNTEHRSHSSYSRSSSPRSQLSQQQQQQPIARLKTASSSSHQTCDSVQRSSYQQYRTVYDYIRDSIKQIERQRNLKQNFSSCVKRPQNDDVVLRRVLAEKKSSSTSKFASVARRNDLQNTESLVNYINHSREQIRVSHATSPNQSRPQQQRLTPTSSSHRYRRQHTMASQNQSDSLEKQQSMLMTTTVGNS